MNKKGGGGREREGWKEGREKKKAETSCGIDNVQVADRGFGRTRANVVKNIRKTRKLMRSP